MDSTIYNCLSQDTFSTIIASNFSIFLFFFAFHFYVFFNFLVFLLLSSLRMHMGFVHGACMLLLLVSFFFFSFGFFFLDKTKLLSQYCYCLLWECIWVLFMVVACCCYLLGFFFFFFLIRWSCCPNHILILQLIQLAYNPCKVRKKTLYKHIMCIWSKYIFRIILWKICSIK